MLGLKEGSLFLRWLSNQSTYNSLVGLDIGPDSLKLLEINASQQPYKVENFATAPLPAGSFANDEIKDSVAIGNLLKSMIKQTDGKKKDVAFAISRSAAIIKNINVDARLNSDEIESRAWIEANRHFPDLVGDIHLDFSVIGPSAQDTTQLEIILVACRKDQIKPYLEIAKIAGLHPQIVDVNCYALERALPLAITPSESLKTIALLNLNFNISNLVVVQDNNLIYAHDQTYDGRRLFTQVGEYLNATDPEKLKNDVKLVEIFKENLTSHLRHTMHFFYSSRPNITIQKIVLAGECAKLPGLAMFIKQEIGNDVVVANPFKNMKFARNINEKELKAHAPTLMLCSGLALSTFK